MTHHYMSEVSVLGSVSTFVWLLRVDLMFVTAGNETDHAHKI